jgi:hypothetical protein
MQYRRSGSQKILQSRLFCSFYVEEYIDKKSCWKKQFIGNENFEGNAIFDETSLDSSSVSNLHLQNCKDKI